MNDERIIGRLEEFKEWAKEEFKSINSNLIHVSAQIDSINRHRWKLHGKIAVIYSIIIIGIEVVFHKVLGG